MELVRAAESYMEKYRTEDETSLASTFTGVVIISPTEESGVLLLYKGLRKFGSHTESGNESSNVLKIVVLPKKYKPKYKFEEETIGVSIHKCSPIELKKKKIKIWSDEEKEYVQGQAGWVLKNLENTFSPFTRLKSGFHYTLKTDSHKLTVYGHEKDSTAKTNAQKHEEAKLKYLLKHIDKKGILNINKINLENVADLSLLLRTYGDLRGNSKSKEYFQLCTNTHLDLKKNPPNSAIGPIARVKCTDVHSLQELPQSLDAANEVMRDIIKLSHKFMPNNSEVLNYYQEETKYFKSIQSISKNPASDVQQLEELQNLREKHFEKCLERVGDAADRMWSGPMFTESDGENYKDSYEKKLRDLINQLVQILFAVRIKSDRSGDIISKFIEGIFLDQRYAVIHPEERHFFFFI